MKNTFLMIAIAVMGCACNHKADAIQDFIPGTYVNLAQGELSRANDTLVITPVNNNDYLIMRRTGYQAFRDGKLLPMKHRIQKLSGVYDPTQRVLTETTNGRLMHFDPSLRQLTVNQASYRKL